MTTSHTSPTPPCRPQRPLLLVNLIVLLLALALPMARPAHAAPIPIAIAVTTTAIADAPGDGCSLYEALNAAFNHKTSGQGSWSDNECTSAGDPNGPVVITFIGQAAGAVITVKGMLPMINRDVTIVGPVIIDGGGKPAPPAQPINQPMFRNASGGSLTLTLLTIRNGYTSGAGGAILDLSGGTIKLVAVSMLNNTAEGSGGAIDSNGVVQITASAFTANQSLGIYPDGTANGGTGFGGAINMSGSGELNVSLTAFSGNTARQRGGAIATGTRSASISDTSFNGNVVTGSGDGNGGGAIYTSGLSGGAATTLQRVTLNGNLTPQSFGGALFAGFQTTTVISDTAFNGNIAGTGSNSTPMFGGAIYSQGGTVQIGRSMLMANIANGNGGAIANDKRGALLVANTTFLGNIANGSDPAGKGGALHNDNSQQGGPVSEAIFKNVTLANNQAAQGREVFNAAGHSVKVGNSILDGTGNPSPGENCVGSITSLGHNLDSGQSCGLNQGGDKQNLPALLDPPSFNGGPFNPILSRMLHSGSPAIDAGDDAMCAAEPVKNKDQRDKERPKDGDGDLNPVCDIGAVENPSVEAGYASAPVAPGPITFGSTVANGGTINATFTISNTGGLPLAVTEPLLMGPNADDFAIVSGLPTVVPPAPAPGQEVTLACAPKAVGQRTAKLRLASSDTGNLVVSYDLVCTGTAAPAPGFASTPAAPGPLNVGQIYLGQQGSAAISIKNTGNLPLTVGSPQIGGLNPGDFPLDPATALAIDAGATQSLLVPCKPTGAGVRSATLTLATNDPAFASVSFSLSCSGAVVPPPSLAQIQTVPSGPLAYRPLLGPEGKQLYVSNFGSSQLNIYNRNGADGKLATPPQNFADGSNLHNALGMAFSPDGKHLYAVGSTSNLVEALSRDQASGALATIANGVTKEGDLYLCGFNNNLPKFCPVSGMNGPIDLEVSPDGKQVYVVSFTDGALVAFSRSQTSGNLFFSSALKNGAGGVSGMTNPRGVAISPDGSHIYVAASPGSPGGGGSLAVFGRNASNGAPSFITAYSNGSGGISGLDGASDVAVSPDGMQVYVVSSNDAAVVAFARNPGDGKLTLIDRYGSPNGGLGGASGIAVSPDGKSVYVAAYNDNTLAVFRRDGGSGALALADVYKDGVNGIGGLKGARKVSVSSDSSHVYVSSTLTPGIAVFALPNPTPFVASLSPASATEGGAGLALTINGAGFAPGAQVLWNGTPRVATVINGSKLTVAVGAGDLAAAGSTAVQVVNPQPTPGPSNSVAFTVAAPGDNPVPAVTAITPQAAEAGGAPFVLTVTGSGFLPSAQVQWNGAGRPTTFVSSTTLQAQISAADIAQPGARGVTVVNPAPGGGPSNAAAFTVAAPGQTPPPSVISVSPLSATAGDKAFTLTVAGSGFTEDTLVRWNGEERATTFDGPTQLRAAISAADVASAGAASVTVWTPAPGGGESNAIAFTIGQVGDNPVPAVISASVTTVEGGLQVTLNGGGFVPGATTLWNGTAHQPTTTGASAITFTISSAEFSNGSAVVSVVNPGPGGGPSNELLFTVYRVALPVVVR